MGVNGLPEIPLSLSALAPDIIKNQRRTWENFKHLRRVGLSNTLLDLGADGTGVKDATAIIQRALDLGIPIFDDGRQVYKTTATINLPNNLTQTSNIEVNISGKLRIRPTGAFDAFYHPYGVTTAGGDAVAPSPILVSMNLTARAGARTVRVSDATGMNVGDLIHLRSDAYWAWGLAVTKAGDTGSQLSEIQFSGATSSNTNNGVLYWELLNTGITRAVLVYKDAAHLNLVATGSRDGDGIMTLTASGGSRLTAAMRVTYTGNDTDSGNTFTISGGRKGELNKITNISGTTNATLSLANPLFLNYNPVADGGSEIVAAWTMTPHTVHIDGLEIEYPAGVGGEIWGLNLHTLDGSTSYVRDVTVKNATAGGMQLTQCYGLQVENMTAIDCFVDGYGYGIGFNACTWSGVQDGYFYRCRHAVDYSGTYPCNGGLVQGVRAIGFTLASNPLATAPANGGAGTLGTHVGANYIYFIGNMISDGLYAFQIRSPNTFIHNNIYWDIFSVFATFAGVPGISVKNNVNRWQAVAPNGSGPGPNVGDYFIDFDGSDVDLDGFTSGFVCEGNEATVATDFIFFRNGTPAIKQWSIQHNNVNIYGSGNVSFLNSNHSAPCTIESSTIIDSNTVRVISGSYQERRNITESSTTPAGFAHGTMRNVGPVHYRNGKAGTVTAATDADDFVFESDGNTGMSLLAPNANAITFRMGSPSANNHSLWRYDIASAILTFGALTASSIVKFFAANVEAIQLRSNLIQLLLNVDAFTASGLITAAAGIKATGGTVSGGAMVKDAIYGLTLQGVAGSSNDFALFSRTGNVVLYLPTATPNDPTIGYPLTLLSTLTVNGTITLADAVNIVPNTSTGTKIGTAANQKIGKWGVTPVIQPASANQAAISAPAAFNNTNGEISGLTIGATYTQAEIEALRDKTEELADDCRALRDTVASYETLVTAIRSALVSTGEIKGSA